MNIPFFDIEERLFENKVGFVIYDQFPVSKGHCLIVPFRNFENYFDAPSLSSPDVIEGSYEDVTNKPVTSFKDFTQEELDELAQFGITDTSEKLPSPEPSTGKKLLKGASAIAGAVVSKTAKSLPIVGGVPEYFEAKEKGDPEDIARAKGMMGAVSPIMPSDIKAGEELVEAAAEPLVEEAKESMQEQDVGFLGGLMTSFGYPTAGSFAAGGFITKRK